MPNVVMNSLVSPTKVITNDTIPNPIAATHNPITLPSIPLPVTSIGVPIMNLKTDNDGEHKAGIKGENEIEAEAIETEDEKFSDTKKSDELMPVEDDSIIEMAHKIEENITETDDIVADNIKSDDSLTIEQPLNKSDDLNSTSDHLNAIEPMECASVNSMASPKHTMANDVIMAESVSVCVHLQNKCIHRLVRLTGNLIVNFRLRLLEVCKWKALTRRSPRTRICMIL